METWKDIDGYEGFYQINTSGMVKSLERFVSYGKNFKMKRITRILKQKTDKQGYKTVILYHNYGTRKYCKVHRLVASAFIENLNNLPQVNHKNGIKTDNRIENLEWITARENMNHARKIGLVIPSFGENHYRNKLSTEQALEIRASNETLLSLAKRFSVDPSTIWAIKNRHRWKHLDNVV